MRIVGVVCGLVLVLVGVAAGALPLTGAEPTGPSYVDCGAAVFGRPDPLPTPGCAEAYAPLPFLTWVGIVMELGIAVSRGVVVRRRDAPAR